MTHVTRKGSLAAALTVAALVGLVAACTETPSAPAAGAPRLSTSSGPVLVECPANDSAVATATIGTVGGSVEVRGSRLDVPLGGVLGFHRFTAKLPVSNYMQLDLGADDSTHFVFQKPATITIDYSRCTRSNIEHEVLTVWQIDPVTRALLAPMGGTDDRANMRITFSTGHLSTYAVAY